MQGDIAIYFLAVLIQFSDEEYSLSKGLNMLKFIFSWFKLYHANTDWNQAYSLSLLKFWA